MAQGGGGGLTQSQLLQITVFMAYLTLFCRKFPKNSRKKSQRSGRGGGVKLVGPKSQLLPKICFARFPYTTTQNRTQHIKEHRDELHDIYKKKQTKVMAEALKDIKFVKSYGISFKKVDLKT